MNYNILLLICYSFHILPTNFIKFRPKFCFYHENSLKCVYEDYYRTKEALENNILAKLPIYTSKLLILFSHIVCNFVTKENLSDMK